MYLFDPLLPGEGDYTVITSRVRAVFSSTMRGNVTFSFHRDGIAQEHNETLILELVPTTVLPTTVLPTGDAVFFQKYLSLTIVDSDCMFTKSIIVF